MEITLNNISKEILENIAEEVHKSWYAERIRQGWRYGKERNDKNKIHPCLINYDKLPEKEKILDRCTVLETIKVILKMGYKIEK